MLDSTKNMVMQTNQATTQVEGKTEEVQIDFLTLKPINLGIKESSYGRHIISTT